MIADEKIKNSSEPDIGRDFCEVYRDAPGAWYVYLRRSECNGNLIGAECTKDADLSCDHSCHLRSGADKPL